MHTSLVLSLVAISLLASPYVAAQYPTKPIRMIVPFPPGGSTDVAARLLANPLAQALGQSIIVDNRPGADGVIAADLTIHAQPDGYTLLFATSTTMSATPTLRKNPPYDPVTQFTPISSVGRNVFFLFVHPGVPARTVKELVEFARANPGKVNYGTGSATGVIATAQFRLLTGLDINHVPYKGDAPVTNDLIGGRLQMVIMGTNPAFAQARNGKLRVLATLLRERSTIAPEVPTFAEAGYPGVSSVSWAGLFGPAHMPVAIVQRLSREVNVIVASPDFTEQLGKLGFVTVGSSPEELASFLKAQLDAWRTAVREAKIPQE